MDELRDKYLQGKLNEVERKAFEEGLSKEEREELAFELGVQEGLASGFRKELREKVAGFEKKEATVRKINPAYISIAASLFIVASLVLYFTREEQSLFDQYYELYPNYEVTVVRGEEAPSSRERAYLAYDMGDFATAITEFNKLDSLASPDYFFRGICHIQLQNYEEALSDLSQEVLKGDQDYADASIWYRALVNLKLNRNENAFDLLEKLSDSSQYAQKVTILKKELIAILN